METTRKRKTYRIRPLSPIWWTMLVGKGLACILAVGVFYAMMVFTFSLPV
jgi:hypothetical protein